ncbi:alpha/beta hydrolase family protein [Roseateles sp. BYS78W]|uniref:Alpha/beta hydrolase family protein n=1 Tax=Pelomonas candidula TaxID=3299025 RepID=A0ABW7H9F7_9BURK
MVQRGLWARFCVVLGIVAMCCVGTPAGAADKPLLPAETFFRHPAMLDVKLSPSGRYVGLTSVRDNRVGLLVADLQTNEPAKVVAFFAKQDVVEFHWVNDERMLFKLGRIEPAAATTHLPGLFSVDVATGKYNELICSEIKSCFQQTGALKFDHGLMWVPRPQPGVRPDEVIIGQYDPRMRHIEPKWLDVTATLTRRMDMPKPPERAMRWWFDSQGRPRLVLSVYDEDGRGEYHWLAPGADHWRQLASFKLLEPPFEPVDVADDGTLYVSESRGAAREAVLTTFDFDTGKPSPRVVVQAPGFDFRGSLLHGDPGQGVLGVRLETDSQVTVWTDPAMKKFQEEVDRRLPGRVNSVVCRRCGAPDMLALVHSFSDRDPGRYLLYRAQTQRWESVSIVMPGVKAAQMSSVDFQRIKARDGRDLPVWLTLPQGVEPGKPAPAVVLAHGGPWVRNGYWRWEPMAQFLASRGYLVIEPEFRGSTGYGDAHYKAGFKQWGLAMQDDLADALLWARQAGLATDRACVMGASYGGYATYMGLIRNPELFRCGVAWVGVADLPLHVAGSFWVSDDISAAARQYGYTELIGDPKTEMARLVDVSPVAQAARIKAPLLMAYGAEDQRVPKEHGRRLRDAMTKAGNPPEYVEYDHEGHGWQLMSTRLDFANRVETFLARYLQASP